MSFLGFIVVAICLIGFGFWVGYKVSYAVMNRVTWGFYRWDTGIFGYRPITETTIIHTNEKVIMGFILSTEDIPAEGMTLNKYLNGE
jgi:hypothetical protein